MRKFTTARSSLPLLKIARAAATFELRLWRGLKAEYWRCRLVLKPVRQWRTETAATCPSTSGTLALALRFEVNEQRFQLQLAEAARSFVRLDPGKSTLTLITPAKMDINASPNQEKRGR